MTAISNYVAQNFGAGRWDRIRQGVRAGLIQTEAFNLIMCIAILHALDGCTIYCQQPKHKVKGSYNRQIHI